MRVWIGIGVALLVLTGCAYKNSPLTFSPYVPKPATVISSKSVQKVYLKSVVDSRPRQSIVASSTNASGQNVGYATTGTALDVWVYDALKRGLSARGYEVVDTPFKEAKILEVSIDELFAHYNGALLSGDNLTGTMQLSLHVKVGEKTTVKKVSQSQNRWHGPIRSSEAFEPFLERLMNDVLARAIDEIHAL